MKWEGPGGQGPEPQGVAEPGPREICPDGNSDPRLSFWRSVLLCVLLLPPTIPPKPQQNYAVPNRFTAVHLRNSAGTQESQTKKPREGAAASWSWTELSWHRSHRRAILSGRGLGTLGASTLLSPPHSPVSGLILSKACHSLSTLDRTSSHLTPGGWKTWSYNC